MIVDDFDLPRAVVSPAKADSPLIVDSNAVLPTPITAEFLQPVTRRHTQVIQILRAVEHLQFSFRLCLERAKLPRRTAPEQLRGVPRGKRPNHLTDIVYRLSVKSKRRPFHGGPWTTGRAARPRKQVSDCGVAMLIWGILALCSIVPGRRGLVGNHGSTPREGSCLNVAPEQANMPCVGAARASANGSGRSGSSLSGYLTEGESACDRPGWTRSWARSR